MTSSCRGGGVILPRAVRSWSDVGGHVMQRAWSADGAGGRVGSVVSVRDFGGGGGGDVRTGRAVVNGRLL